MKEGTGRVERERDGEREERRELGKKGRRE